MRFITYTTPVRNASAYADVLAYQYSPGGELPSERTTTQTPLAVSRNTGSCPPCHRSSSQ